MTDFLKGKRVLVTGVCGTVGRAITDKLISGQFGDLKEFVGIDNNESELFFVEQEYGSERAHFFLRDLRDYRGIREVCHGVDIIFHTAALKHVGICEKSPAEAVQTNIDGLQNLIRAAQRCEIERFIFTSSDKAVNPTNVMGTSKLMGERLVTAANNSRENKGTVFTSTRFGNVLGSRGSVVPIFKNQILNGKDITLTSREMTRFVMTISEAADLVIESSALAKGGEVFITKMPVIRIEDLGQVMIDVLAGEVDADKRTKIHEIGVKPGEKLYEELMSEEETSRAIETEDYFVVLPAFRDLYPVEYVYQGMKDAPVLKPYKSSEEELLTPETLKSYLLKHDII
ncbi:polysaccharide biosynthesis protein [Parahaliea aestuarii]|uniref:Polysaccharide biosynthesis protein n=1 Tax=Parahaliea aestuarii TaxID=1852021 RepID=A0A5C8ZML1_9GAMM|nr:polysaccharide biosynthesis protein [Parahaliea aestuarii]TXS89425.1 polysaccharide biosynthesis protein [Parahaliea aestuarii]